MKKINTHIHEERVIEQGRALSVHVPLHDIADCRTITVKIIILMLE